MEQHFSVVLALWEAVLVPAHLHSPHLHIISSQCLFLCAYDAVAQTQGLVHASQVLCHRAPA